ncbi:MAG: DUF6318 family protein [Dermatophilaceae bacterium]
MSKPSKWVVAAVAGALLCLVTACSGSSAQPGPTATATGTDSPTTSASPSATQSNTATTQSPTADLNIPEAARPPTLAGAEEFAKYFATQVNTAFQTANPAAVKQLSTSTCPACAGMVSDIEAMRERDGHVDGEVWSVQSSIVESFNPASSSVVVLEVHQPPVPIKDSSGNVIDRYEKDSARLALTLVHNGANWQVSRLQLIK